MKAARAQVHTLEQVHKEKRRIQLSSLLVFPAGTLFFALVLTWVFYCSRLQSMQIDKTQSAFQIFFLDFWDWVTHLSANFGNDFQPGSLLFALAALSIAIFLALGTSPPVAETQDTVAGRANRMVLDDLSVFVAIACAVLAWLTLLTIDPRNVKSVPDIIAAAATAWLCSATVPLHRVRADVHRFTLLEAQNHKKTFMAREVALKNNRNSMAHFSRRRWFLSYLLWMSGCAVISTTVFAGYILAAGYAISWRRVLVCMMVMAIMAGWSWFTSEFLAGCALDWRQKQRFLTFSNIMLYAFCFLVFTFLAYFIFYRLWNSRLAVIAAVIMIGTPVGVAFLDRRWRRLGLLTGMQIRRTRRRIRRLVRTMEFSNRQLGKNTARVGR